MRAATSASSFKLSLSRLLLGSMILHSMGSSPASAQAAASSGQYNPPLPGSAPSNNQVLSGRVNTELVPAEKLLSQGKYADAEGMFREILVANPTDMLATVGLGTALAKQFKLDGADNIFDRVLATDPNNAQAYAGKATIMLNRLQSSSGSVRANRDSMLKQAEDFAQKACTLAPAMAEAHYTLGAVLKEEGKVDQAASEFRNALNFDPQHAFAMSALGQIQLDSGSLVEAETSFKNSIALNSGNASAHTGLGATYVKEGKLDDAVKELNTALYQFPNSWPTHMILGQAYQMQGNSLAAIKEYNQSSAIKPENVEPYLRISQIYEDRGDLEMALADLRSGITQDPYNVEVREHIADIALRLEKPDDAIKAYQTILAMSPNNPQAIKGLSQALYLKAQKAAVGAMLTSNDYEAAMKAIGDAIALSPNDLELYLAKAKLMSLAGVKLPDLASVSQPKNDGERITYAQVLMSTGDFQNASAQIKTVIAAQQDPKAIFAVADISLMIKDLDDAESAYKKAQGLAASPDRVQRGLGQIAALRKSSADDTKVAGELSDKKQWDGAVAKYRLAIEANPFNADAREGIAEALEESSHPTSAVLAESAQQYQNYLSLKNDLPAKEREKMQNRIEKLKEKSLKQKEREEKDKH
ncbi:MAG: tetratricopeptide repeat protein [Cyanobacteria bacterium REEB67]|nr:tetratricopeptide repeat protein [Cyanobacteria bacterium REEB67]